MKSPVVRQYLAEEKVEWIFNLGKAPWWGGLFQRMMRSVKRSIKKTIGGARLTYGELSTTILESEITLNAIPLSYVTSTDAEEPLTPLHLLHGRRLMSLPDPCTGDLMDPFFELSTELSKRMNHLSNVMKHFWRRWGDGYLIELKNSHRHSAKNAAPTPVAVGNLLVVCDEDLPRGLWKLSRVRGLVTGADGLVRGATIRGKSRGNRSSTRWRPLQCLYPLEIHGGDDSVHVRARMDSTSDPVLERPRRNPGSQAAVDAENRRRALIEELSCGQLNFGQ